MESYITTEELSGRESEHTKRMYQFYSVEFSVRGIDVPYQFRIWDMSSACMNVLVNEFSDILPRLKVGDSMEMKYYSTDSVYHSEYLKTAIRHITKSDQGRFKGHYLVGLEILEKRDRKKIH